jgi:hypothetical protein
LFLASALDRPAGSSHASGIAAKMPGSSTESNL